MANDLFLSQQKYIYDLLDHTKMLEANIITMPISTSVPLMPISTSVPLIHFDSVNLIDTIEYRQVISNLWYLTFTYSDITYVINKLSQFMYKLTFNH